MPPRSAAAFPYTAVSHAGWPEFLAPKTAGAHERIQIREGYHGEAQLSQGVVVLQVKPALWR